MSQEETIAEEMNIYEKLKPKVNATLHCENCPNYKRFADSDGEGECRRLLQNKKVSRIVKGEKPCIYGYSAGHVVRRRNIKD
jgi:hypothetical protein